MSTKAPKSISRVTLPGTVLPISIEARRVLRSSSSDFSRSERRLRTRFFRARFASVTTHAIF
ncbi:MAG TPA: hypothetical protein DCQ98_06315 [Planctomycetaceae bacterium]|nr:hypothetical protein [Planctomycetaceae bacterium]